MEKTILILATGAALAVIAIITLGIGFSKVTTPPAIQPVAAAAIPADTPAPTPEPNGAICTLQDLAANVQFNAGAGLMDGVFVLKNVTNHKCTINAGNYVTPNYNPGMAANLMTGHAQEAKLTQQGLDPGQAIYARVRFGNGSQCSGSSHEVNVNFTDEISPGQVITFTDSDGNQNFKVEVCDDINQTSRLSVNAWAFPGN
jgi:hypothetical protein